ncbi:MAG: tRNA (adenosine(37)-N6)-threonylcarbamoyltransferase complex transferase subunit TsaD [Calditrichaeota bacterium]|nr:tRNA (adenosine(37)-N6)-threonylcarbamoyltransferase complex transferase subunit TsaD [Calditrichota bacterium]
MALTVLGIETSCDETSVAVYADGRLLSNVVLYQVIHERYGGVVPEYASRAHMRTLVPTLNLALEKAGVTLKEIDGVGVTYGPGLVGSLLVGLNVAKGLSVGLRTPLVGINHIEGHIFANFVGEKGPALPSVCLVVSGGHTQLVLIKALGEYKLLGKTRDDAAGEAFDKVARVLGLGYPGGPAIEKAAEAGDPDAIAFPKSFLEEGYEFSFSGIKTAVLYYMRELPEEERRNRVADVAASFQKAVVEVLVEKTLRAARETGARSVCLAGGVARNKKLRDELERRARAEEVEVFVPPPEFCTDNAAMIARAAHFYLERGQTSPLTLAPAPSLNLAS